MAYHFVRQPYLLLETVQMLYLAFERKSPLSAPILRRLPKDSVLRRRAQALDEIIRRVCRGLDRDDPELSILFSRVETDSGFEDICLAQLMTLSFCTLQQPDFDANIQEIHEIWADLQRRGVGISSHGIAGLIFSPEAQGDLFEQIAALKLPAEFRLALYRVFRCFDEKLDRLAALIRPYARRLEQEFAENDWLFAEAEEYWSGIFAQEDPLHFLARAVDDHVVHGASEETRVAVFMMNYDALVYDMAASKTVLLPCNILYIGGVVTAHDSVHSRGGDLESLAAAMKALSDRRRLELLQRLGTTRSYCHELAEAMDVDPGNLSRSLAVLYDCGFLRQERENLRCYYETDWDSLQRFFTLAEHTLKPKG